MKSDDDSTVLSPTEARGARKSGIVWKVLAVSIVLAVIAMILIGQMTSTPTG